MMRPVLNPGRLKWSGEHWINYLREPGSDNNSGMVSLYHTRFSSAGEGTTAFVDITGLSGCQGVFTDNVEVAEFIREMIRGRGNPFDRELPIYEAKLFREGDVRYEPAWVIENGRYHIKATWSDIQAPIIVEGPAPTFGPDRDFFTLLFFADMATITVNGQLIKGIPYLRNIWQKSIGDDHSSCVFALAETMIMLPQDEAMYG